MTVNHTFKTSNPLHLEMYRVAQEEYKAHGLRIVAFAEALHPEAMAFGSRSRWSGKQGVSGIVGPRQKVGEHSWSPRTNQTLEPVPVGWRWMKTYDCYRPDTRVKGGKEAKAALAALNAQAVPDGGQVLVKALGMPTEVWLGNHIYWPGTWVDLEGSVWICYGVRLDAVDPERTSREKHLPDPLPEGLTEQPLSAFHLAQEAAEAAKPKDEVA